MLKLTPISLKIITGSRGLMKSIKQIIKKTSIKSRMIISLALILVAAFIITNLQNYAFSHRAIRENLMNSVLPLTRDNIYSEMQTKIVRPVFISSVMANDTFLKDWAISGEKNRELITKYLRAIKNKYDFFSAFFVSDKTGYYYHYNGILKNISPADSHDVWYYRFKKLNREYELDVDTDQAGGNKLTIFINHRLNDYNGRLIGITGVGLNLERIADMIRSYNSMYGCNIYLTDRSGTIQVHSDHTLIEKVNIRNMPGLSEEADRILSGPGDPELHEFESDGRKILLTSRIIPEFNWFLFVEIDEQSRMAPTMGNIKRNIAAGIIISLLVLAIAIVTVNHFQSEMNLLAVTDELTGAYNRKEFQSHFRKAAYSSHRNRTPFSIIIFDIDNFKGINDTRGHNEGDRVLKAVSKLASKSKRLTDMLVRWGGDEFLLLTSGGINESAMAAERLRKLVEEYDFNETDEVTGTESREIFQVTISCGVTEYTRGDSVDSAVSRADTALYRSKLNGKNRVECEQAEVEKPRKKTSRRKK